LMPASVRKTQPKMQANTAVSRMRIIKRKEFLRTDGI
jgi:hypothetical protein